MIPHNVISKSRATIKKPTATTSRRISAPRASDRHAGRLARPFVTHHQSQRRAGKQAAQVRGIIDDSATHKSNRQIEQNDRQQPRSKGSFETFRQLAPVFHSKNEEHADQTKQRARRAGRRIVVTLDQKTGQSRRDAIRE